MTLVRKIQCFGIGHFFRRHIFDISPIACSVFASGSSFQGICEVLLSHWLYHRDLRRFRAVLSWIVPWAPHLASKALLPLMAHRYRLWGRRLVKLVGGYGLTWYLSRGHNQYCTFFDEFRTAPPKLLGRFKWQSDILKIFLTWILFATILIGIQLNWRPFRSKCFKTLQTS
jgi:hypothetical protein